MAATEQELNQFLQVPKMKARVRRFLKLNSSKTLEEILAELEEEKSVSPLVNYNSPLYRSIMTLVQSYYKEEQKIILNLQIFYQNQAKLEKISDSKSSKILNSASHHILDEAEKPLKSQENQNLWERLRILQKEIQDLQQQREETEQELEQIETAKEKVNKQIEAVERLTDKAKPQVHTEQIKNLAIVQDVLDKGINLKPSEVKKVFANPGAVLTGFNKEKAALNKKSEAILQKEDLIQTQLSEKQEDFNNTLKNPACNNFQLTPYTAPVPKPISKKNVEKENQEEKTYGTQKWHKEGEEQARASEIMERSNEASSPRPSFGKQA